MDRSYIINYLVNKIDAKSYLEIGIGDGINFKNIKCDNKLSVDINPDFNPDIVASSDDFFRKNKESFDVIFIDGLHHADQVQRDILNSLSVLETNGFIVCHDTLPFTFDMQTIPIHDGMWCGNTWESIINLRQTRPDLEITTLDVETGITIIRFGIQEILKINETLSYDLFIHNKSKWMNIMNLIEFYTWMEEPDVHLKLIDHYIHSSDSDKVNFYLGKAYQDIGHSAAAVSFYIRAAERAVDDTLKYESMLLAAKCFEFQGCRGTSVIGLIQHAVALLPERPEGYYLLSRYYEHNQQWFDGYLIASIGIKLANYNTPILRTNIGYVGEWGVLYEKAVVSWWCGLCEESMDTFRYLLLNYELHTVYRNSCIDNLKKLDNVQFNFSFRDENEEIIESFKHLNLYSNDSFSNLKIKFRNADTIYRNYSEAYQDMFVLTVHDGKRNGTYLEIGAGFPLYGNNTYLLESKYDWKGVSIDISPELVDRFNSNRRNQAILCDATTVDYNKLISDAKLPTVIDYLQLDCDPPSVTYSILEKIPFDKYKFGVITYEHDHYNDSEKIYKEKSRQFLKQHGYVLVVTNVAPSGDLDFEDWWVHPDVINLHSLDKFGNVANLDIKPAHTIFLKN
jgi:SAM-dependent methyltransferase